MSFLPIPDITKDNIYEITPRLFTNRGIKLVLIDVDNTIAPYGVSEADERLKAWAAELKAAGLKLHILSNSHTERPRIFAKALDIAYEDKSRKPFTKKIKKVLKVLGYEPGETALIGDQVYTDVLCAKRAGVLAVLVKPIDLKNPLLRARYWLEAPFRLKPGGKK